jgi:hypothetical protein
MEIEEENFVISPSRELVPISNNLTNFQTDFSIVSDRPFRALIVNQELLDKSDEDVQLRNVSNGVFSGKIVKDSGKKDEWYIAVEADEVISAKLHFTTKEIPEAASPRQNAPVAAEFSNAADAPLSAPKKCKKRLSFWIIILIIGLIGAAVFAVYKFLFKRKKCAPPIENAPPEPPRMVPYETKRDDGPPPLKIRRSFLDIPREIPEEEEEELVKEPPKEKVRERIEEDEKLDLDFSDLPEV